ncbi:MAG: methyltransferase [Thermoflexales bacterium]|nr:methyltransferase [Thermoflexales bacterium]
MSLVVLSHFQVQPLFAARQAGQQAATISPDLGLSSMQVVVGPDGVYLPDSRRLTWEELAVIRDSERACFRVEGDRLYKIQFFSELTNQVYSLMPTHKAPTMLISGISMHRFKGIDPHEDTLRKIKSIAPLTGRVLDTATGLGYTAIQAAKTAESVTSIELDPTALEVARLNPWSQALFDNPKISQIVGDSFEEIQRLGDACFTRIIHDPPVFKLAGDLYSGEFYSQLFRLLRRGGKLFHYVGDPESKSGRVITKGVARRLKDAGFSRVMSRPAAFGVVAYK